MMGKLAAVVVAAGKGTRMGAAVGKQFLPIGDRPMLVRTLDVFQRMPEVESVIVVTGREDIPKVRSLAARFRLDKVVDVIAGGPERQQSVLHGLRALSEDVEWVLVHDAARPFVREAAIRRCLRKAAETGAAVLAVPVKDTIKVVDGHGTIQTTPDRQSLRAIQTPQAFRRADLLAAHRKAEAEGFVGTDDAMLMERAGIPVQVAEGDEDNIKITTPEDLQWAEFRLARERGQG